MQWRGLKPVKKTETLEYLQQVIPGSVAGLVPGNLRTAGTGVRSLNSINVIGTGEDRFAKDAVESLAAAAGVTSVSSSNKLPRGAVKSALYGGLRLAGHDTTDLPLATAFDLACSGFVNRPSDFPSVMAQVTDVIMDAAASQAATTFERWAYRLPDADNFDRTSIGGAGVIDGLDDYIDGETVKQTRMQEESKGWIEVNPSANDIALTWLMVADPLKFGRFLEMIAELGSAGPRTLNRRMVELLATNQPTIDEVPLFDNSHGNLMGSGSAPNDAALQAMAKLHAAQRAPGSEDPSGRFPSIILVPDALRITAETAFSTLLMVDGLRVARVEEQQSYFKDRIQVVSDPMLDSHSTTAWYSLIDPSTAGLRSFVYRYLAGYGPTGKSRSYFEPRRRSLVFGRDFVAGCALTKHRGVVKNPGA